MVGGEPELPAGALVALERMMEHLEAGYPESARLSLGVAMIRLKERAPVALSCQMSKDKLWGLVAEKARLLAESADRRDLQACFWQADLLGTYVRQLIRRNSGKSAGERYIYPPDRQRAAE